MANTPTPSWLPESAGLHLLQDVPTAPENATCGQILESLRHRKYEYAEVVVIVDARGHVTGMLSAGALASHAADAPVQQFMHRDIAVAGPDMDQEHVASLAIRNLLGTVPVVDAHGKLLGIIPPQAMLAVLRREHVEDLHRLTGMLRESEVARAALVGPPTRRARHRLPWLFVGVAGSAVAAVVMSRFESMIEARVAIAFFLPGIVYLADAIGTQTEAIAVRGLSFGRVPMRRLLLGELWTGLLIGAVLGTVSGATLWLVLRDAPMAFAVAVALLGAGGIASAIGLMLPWLFHRAGMDPAYGSGPLATVVQDVLSLLVYFTCIGVFMGIP